MRQAAENDKAEGTGGALDLVGDAAHRGEQGAVGRVLLEGDEVPLQLLEVLRSLEHEERMPLGRDLVVTDETIVRVGQLEGIDIGDERPRGATQRASAERMENGQVLVAEPDPNGLILVTDGVDACRFGSSRSQVGVG